MDKCPFLTTVNEEVECFMECSFYKWIENSGKCPFREMKEFKPFIVKNIHEYNFFIDEKETPLGIFFKETSL